MPPLRAVVLGFATAGSLAAAQPAAAQLLGAFPTEPSGALSTNAEYTLGYAFNVTAPVTVGYLAYYDAGGDGLAFAHQVGIWSSTGALLADASVPAGTGALLIGSFRLVALPAPLTLDVGTGYTVGGENPIHGDAGIVGGPFAITVPSVQFVGSRYAYDAGFRDPTTVGAGAGGYYGGNFALALPGTTTAPEPGTAALLGAGLLLAGGCARRPRA